ncbi:MAG: hypothetical protein N2202_06725 [Proteobacteria bacterium]|nr:hypothetical protein [Pseudomonadota bacterium]
MVQEILKKFLKMPINKTREVFEEFMSLDGAIKRGEGLKSFIYVPGRRENRVLLVAHADTFWDDEYNRPNKPSGLEIIFEKGVYKNRFGGFGADDRAGCAMLWLLKDLGHSLLITSGEERSQIGANFLMEDNLDIAEEINKTHQFVVQLDRRGSCDYVCYEVGTDEFERYIESETGYKKPEKFTATDIVVLCRDICGVNLSIGYYEEHKNDAYLVFDEWLKTLNIVQKWLSKNNLPKFRRQQD